jgi:hypothetical protein
MFTMGPILRTACTTALLSLGCAKSTAEATEAPVQDDTGAGSQATASDPSCPAGGPSVSIRVRGHAGGELPQDQLGALLEWIGGFTRPCLEQPPEAPDFTMSIDLGEDEQPPTLELVDRETLPGLAACIDAGFADAPPPPPPGSLKVLIVIPWGCPTLAPDFQQQDEAEP